MNLSGYRAGTSEVCVLPASGSPVLTSSYGIGRRYRQGSSEEETVALGRLFHGGDHRVDLTLSL